MGTIHELLNTMMDHHSLYDSLYSCFSTAVMGTGGVHPACSIESGEPGCCFKPAGPAAGSLPPLRPPLPSKLPRVSEKPSQGLQQPIYVFSFCVRASMPAHDTASRQFLGKLTCLALLNHYSLELHLNPDKRQPSQQAQLGN